MKKFKKKWIPELTEENGDDILTFVVTTERRRGYLTAKGRKEDKREGGRDRKTG